MDALDGARQERDSSARLLGSDKCCPWPSVMRCKSCLPIDFKLELELDGRGTRSRKTRDDGTKTRPVRQKERASKAARGWNEGRQPGPHAVNEDTTCRGSLEQAGWCAVRCGAVRWVRWVLGLVGAGAGAGAGAGTAGRGGAIHRDGAGSALVTCSSSSVLFQV